MISLNTIRARAAKLEEKQAALSNDDYFLPPVDAYAFQWRLSLLEIAEHGGLDSVRREIDNLHPLELKQITDLNPDDWRDDDAKPVHNIRTSRERIVHIQKLIKEALREGRP